MSLPSFLLGSDGEFFNEKDSFIMKSTFCMGWLIPGSKKVLHYMTKTRLNLLHEKVSINVPRM